MVVPIIVFLYYASYSKDYTCLNLSTSGIYISGHVVYVWWKFISIFDWLASSSFLYLYHFLLRGILFFFFILVHYYPLYLKSRSIYNTTICSPPSSSSPIPLHLALLFHRVSFFSKTMHLVPLPHKKLLVVKGFIN